MVSTHLKNISQIGNLPQIGMKMKNIWNHHLDYPPGKKHIPSERHFWRWLSFSRLVGHVIVPWTGYFGYYELVFFLVMGDYPNNPPKTSNFPPKPPHLSHKSSLWDVVWILLHTGDDRVLHVFDLHNQNSYQPQLPEGPFWQNTPFGFPFPFGKCMFNTFCCFPSLFFYRNTNHIY